MRLRQASHIVSISAEVNRYLHNIVVFLRLNRAVAGGVSVKATKHFVLVAKSVLYIPWFSITWSLLLSNQSRSLASLHGIDYLTPSVVCLAAKKVYRHRIMIARPEDDRSLQYGSHLDSVRILLKGVDPDRIINTVLSEVETPLWWCIVPGFILWSYPNGKWVQSTTGLKYISALSLWHEAVPTWSYTYRVGANVEH